MKVFSTDIKHDFTLDSSGVLAFDSGLPAYTEIVDAALRTMLGEIQLDTDLGIDYENTVWVSKTRVEDWKRLVRQRVADFEFVVGIDSFDTWFDGDTMHYKLVLKTDQGITVAEG